MRYKNLKTNKSVQPVSPNIIGRSYPILSITVPLIGLMKIWNTNIFFITKVFFQHKKIKYDKLSLVLDGSYDVQYTVNIYYFD